MSGDQIPQSAPEKKGVPSPAVFTLVVLVTNGLIFLLGALLFKYGLHASLFNKLSLFGDPLQTIGSGVGAGLLGAAVILAAYRFWPGFAASANLALEAFKKLPGWYLLVASLFAGVAEESLFRGGLQPVFGMVGAALLFGLLHTNFRRELWAYGLTAFLIGMFFGAGYGWTGILWVPILGHTVYNLVITWAISRKIIGPAGGNLT